VLNDKEFKVGYLSRMPSLNVFVKQKLHLECFGTQRALQLFSVNGEMQLQLQVAVEGQSAEGTPQVFVLFLLPETK